MPTRAIALVALAAVVLAGCANTGGSDRASGDGAGDVADLDVTATTGGIHGFVVDEKITPIEGATVSVSPGDASATTNDLGAFVINGLEPGVYFVKAEHPLFDSAQQSVDVVAGEADPDDVKFQLNRVIFAQPSRSCRSSTASSSAPSASSCTRPRNAARASASRARSRCRPAANASAAKATTTRNGTSTSTARS
jgi:Carboxypeptidase regulatory-like domain